MATSTSKTIELIFPSDNKSRTAICSEIRSDQQVKVIDYGKFVLEVTEPTIGNPTKTVEIKFVGSDDESVPNVRVHKKKTKVEQFHTPIASFVTAKPKPLVSQVKNVGQAQPRSHLKMSSINSFPHAKVQPNMTHQTHKASSSTLSKQNTPTSNDTLQHSKVSTPESPCYNELLDLIKNDLILSTEEFVCSLCENFINRRQGILLKGCLHSFCRTCLIEKINNDHGPTGIVQCPMKIEPCSSNLEDEEVRALLGTNFDIFTLKIMLSLDEMAKEKGGRAFDTFPELLDADNYEFILNNETFECAICYMDIAIGDGVVLKNCLHKFCKECIVESVKHSDDVEVKCPFIDDDGSCEFKIQEREVRGLVPEEVFDKHLAKSLKLYESGSESAYHCKSPDCHGFIEKDENLRGFTCQVCSKVNCIGCKAIHTNMNCVEYQDTINPGGRQLRENSESENAIKNMIAAEQAMWCPKCGIPVMKDDGCDYITCSACKLGICWRTKKPRHPITKENGTVIDGCHCNFAAGKRCHPMCGNCH